MNLRVLDRTDDLALGSFLALYERSFPPEERDAVEEILRQIESPSVERPFWNVVAEADSVLVGLTRCGFLPTTQVGFLVHIAVSSEFRRRGLGGQLLADAARRCEDFARSKGSGYSGMILEIERHEDADDPEDLMVRLDRIQWFLHRGARLLTPSYTQPSLGPGLSPVPLGLYLLGGKSPNVREVIQGFYAEAFGLDSEHPLVRRALSGARP